MEETRVVEEGTYAKGLLKATNILFAIDRNRGVTEFKFVQKDDDLIGEIRRLEKDTRDTVDVFIIDMKDVKVSKAVTAIVPVADMYRGDSDDEIY